MNALFRRRSIRRYTSEPVANEMIIEFIKAGMSAPSAGNEQPWHFIIINERHLLDEIPKIHPHSEMIRQATVAILVCGDLTLEKHKGYWVQDVAAATENILISIADHGLGAVWLGLFPREDRVRGIGKLLNIPEYIVPFSLIPVGYPAESKPAKDSVDSSRIHYNYWKGGE